MTDWHIEFLTTERTRALAECHIACWREAYRGLVPDHVLDAFDVERRAALWERTRARDPRATRVAVTGDTVVGFVGTGHSRDPDPVATRELHALYVRADRYGSGLADALLTVALRPDASYSLWVFRDNPRARAFYRRYGFVEDGATRHEDFGRALLVRMVRPATARARVSPVPAPRNRPPRW